MWSACESCMRACLATCRLACDTEQVQRAQRARCRVRPPSSPRRCHERSLLRKTNARSILQRCKFFARGLRPALHSGVVECRLTRHAGSHDALRHGTRLRARIAFFLGTLREITGVFRVTTCTTADELSCRCRAVRRLPMSFSCRFFGQPTSRRRAQSEAGSSCHALCSTLRSCAGRPRSASFLAAQRRHRILLQHCRQQHR